MWLSKDRTISNTQTLDIFEFADNIIRRYFKIQNGTFKIADECVQLCSDLLLIREMGIYNVADYERKQWFQYIDQTNVIYETIRFKFKNRELLFKLLKFKMDDENMNI